VTDPDLLVHGALDLHAHGSPEFTLAMPGRVSNVEWAQLAAKSRMRGFVIKSHIFPTTAVANAIGQLYPELDIFSSITLNPVAGGLNPLAVELAIAAGAKIVWMPTWSARQLSPHRSVFLERMQPHIPSLDPAHWPMHGLTVVDEAGELRPEVDQILVRCARSGVAIASGHLPIEHSLLVCARARELGAQFILTHPLSGSVGASIPQQQAVAAQGGWIEHVFIGCMPMHQRMDPRHIVDSVEAVGAEHCVLATDAIEAWNPPEPEVLRMFIATMLSLGVPEDQVHLMTHDNPAKALGLDPEWPPRLPEEIDERTERPDLLPTRGTA
jgi:uncharacterized protein DUF6282